MPVTYTFEGVGAVYSEVVPGSAYFDVTITGLVDVQSGHYVTVTSATCRFTDGVNCTGYDMDVETRTDTTSGRVYWKLVGTTVFSWTNPKTGNSKTSVRYESDEYFFDAQDYI